MKRLFYPFGFALLIVAFTSCDPSLTMEDSPVLYHKGYDFNVDKTEVNRGGFRMYVFEKDTFYVVTNDVHCVSDKISELDKVFSSDFRVIKKPSSQTLIFMRKDDTTEITFDLSEEKGIFALWSAPCD